MTPKHFITADTLLRDSFLLADKIFQSGFRPDLIVGIWRGGSAVAIAIHEYLEYQGVCAAHLPVKTSSYFGIEKQHSQVNVEGVELVTSKITSESQVLLVDDVFDSGRSLLQLIDELENAIGPEIRPWIKTAVPWYKPANNQTHISPDYYLKETSDWLVFPHELAGLSKQELLENKPEISGLLD